MKTAHELVEWCKRIRESAVYWYGTFYQRCTEDLYKRKCIQYPEHYTTSRATAYKRDIENGKMCVDCVGMIKGFIWQDVGGKVVYASNGCPDKSAEGLEQWAITQGAEHGPIATLPEQEGIILVKNGHTGVYIGHGYAIEAKGFVDDIKITNGTKWLRWYKHPCIDYPAVHTDTSCPYAEPTRNVRRGMAGNDVRWVQWMLARTGYQCKNVDGVDGIFGSGTVADVRAFQKSKGLEVDGIVGINTRTALKRCLHE